MMIALSQMNIEWEDKENNKSKVLDFINEAKELNVEFIVFPEMTLTGFSMNVENIAESNDGETIQWFKNIARCYNINIGFGVVEKTESEFGKNKFMIINCEGVIISDYTKLHPFSYGKTQILFVLCFYASPDLYLYYLYVNVMPVVYYYYYY